MNNKKIINNYLINNYTENECWMNEEKNVDSIKIYITGYH